MSDFAVFVELDGHVTQTVERPLMKPEIGGSNPVIGTFLFALDCIGRRISRGREWLIFRSAKNCKSKNSFLFSDSNLLERAHPAFDVM